MLERKVEGVAVLTFGEEEPVLDQLAHHDMPMVLAEFKLTTPRRAPSCWITPPEFDAAVKHLAGLGHRKIAFLAGPHNIHSAITRENDFRTAMERAGLKIQKSGSLSAITLSRAAWQGSSACMGLKRQPTAILCSNDMTAIGVLRAAYMGACGCRRISPWSDLTTSILPSSRCRR